MNTEHDCPGGCGRSVPRAKLACLDCWYLLPADLRRPLDRFGGRKLEHVSRALQWYRENVRGGETA